MRAEGAMIRQNLHAHCTYDDGRNTPEEMVRASQCAGLESVGISLHSPMPFETAWAAKAEEIPAFLCEMRRLRQAYAGQIRVYAGIEWDVLSPASDLARFDYVIGSVHHLPVGSRYPTVDDREWTTEAFLERHFGGDADAAAEWYYRELEKVAQEPEADIVGHFDLLTKFNERRRYFDEESPAYRRAALRTMEALVAAGKIFEVNTGAISRGYRSTPYPSRALLCALACMGGRVTVSADAHDVRAVATHFEQAEALICACGFREIWQLEPQDGKAAFVPHRIGERPAV